MAGAAAVLDRTGELAAKDAGGPAKAAQILDGARAVFLADGFDGASMNEIARRAGVSKGTLYVYFPSKEALFEALIRTDRRRQAERIFEIDIADRDIAAVLTRVADGLLQAMTQPSAVAHFRTVMAAAARFPQLGRAFYEAGPAYSFGKLAEWIAGQHGDGLLHAPDATFAAMQFIELCQVGVTKPLLFGMIDTIEPERREKAVREAVATFLARYGRGGGA